ncbi:FixH family protein [Pedobacter gandavensis]|uniref:Nitrogen fixation protein FixH n=1 Tax=Pedobacter gandavensis TaxID=2679963 RepID=A0ABR6F1E1_9SPHI|nr:FixH family protein [Pedobacter gandavensis]MBB2150478.1 nitrogen fixation protein FixH [Pedobacter gandavensis]
MKWNWGTKLVIGMVCFMSFIIILAIKMFNSSPDALVDNDYYEKGLDYDKEYQLKEQVKTDHAQPDVQVSTVGIILTFKAPAEGKINLVRSADKRMDKVIPIKTDAQNRVAIPLTGIAKGRWKLIINWTSAGKSYLDEQEVMVE